MRKIIIILLLSMVYLVQPVLGATVITDNFVRMTDRNYPIYVYNDVVYSRKPANHYILQKSTDDGVNWTDLYTFSDDTVGHMVVTLDGSILVDQDASGQWADPPSVVWRSSDNGSTFAPALDYTKGGVLTWSFDTINNKVLLGEYGEYPSLIVFESTSSGATTTWSTIFTHPRSSGDRHIHKVYYDKIDTNNIFISYGDGDANKGMSYSDDGGSSFNELTNTLQPTWIEATTDYFIFFGDNTGDIWRMDRSELGVATTTLTKVLNGDTFMSGRYDGISYYAGGKDNNNYVYAGGVHYGINLEEPETYANFLISKDEGATWDVLKEFYPKNNSASTGASYISNITDSNLLFVAMNNGGDTYKFDANQPKSSIDSSGAKTWTVRADPL